MKKGKTKTKERINIWAILLIVAAFLALAAFLIGQLFLDNGVISGNTIADNTSINGVNISGLTQKEATDKISNMLSRTKNSVQITLNHGEKSYLLNGPQFETASASAEIDKIFNKSASRTLVEKINDARKGKQSRALKISYRYALADFDNKIDGIIAEIERDPVEPMIKFSPDSDEMFTLIEGTNGIKVKRDELVELIDKKFENSCQITIDVPTEEVPFNNNGEELITNTALRSKFSTSIATSDAGRKNNVLLALKSFNGLIVEPQQEISFNQTTGEQTAEKGYKKAKVIINGRYVEGYGGGCCQSSTTLYNALILSDIEILEANPHSMPVSYVPLAFDAMVSSGSSDMRFKNNLTHPIYIKCYGDEENAYVEIYGEPLEEGLEIKRRAEFIETLPHPGDTIVKDVSGEYADKITYAGEYLRIKKPQEGYHSKAYIQYYKNGELESEKLIRDEIYQPQQGIVMEGTETLGEGMIIPENNVEIIPPQAKPNIEENQVAKKIGTESPSNLNP